MKHCVTCLCRPSAAATNTHTFEVVTEQGDPVLGTDDWAEAEQARIDAQKDSRQRAHRFTVTGGSAWLFVILPAVIGWVEIIRWVVGGLFS